MDLEKLEVWSEIALKGDQNKADSGTLRLGSAAKRAFVPKVILDGYPHSRCPVEDSFIKRKKLKPRIFLTFCKRRLVKYGMKTLHGFVFAY